MMKPFCLCKNRKLSIQRENTSPHKPNQANQPTQQPNRVSSPSEGTSEKLPLALCGDTWSKCTCCVLGAKALVNFWVHLRWILLETPQSYYPLDFELIFGCCTFRNFLLLHTFFVTPTLSQATPTSSHATPCGVHTHSVKSWVFLAYFVNLALCFVLSCGHIWDANSHKFNETDNLWW